MFTAVTHKDFILNHIFKMQHMRNWNWFKINIIDKPTILAAFQPNPLTKTEFTHLISKLKLNNNFPSHCRVGKVASDTVRAHAGRAELLNICFGTKNFFTVKL